MPTYDYYCSSSSCGHEFECFHSIKDAALVECPVCGQLTLRRKIGSGAGIIFKGSGFYETDYKRKSGEGEKSESAAAKASSSEAGTGDSSGKTSAAVSASSQGS